MAILVAFFLVLLPADTRAPLHILFQLIAILGAGVILFSRRSATHTKFQAASISNWPREIAAWLVLMACLLPFANYANWLDTPRSVAACQTLAALGLFWFAAAYGRRYAIPHLVASALCSAGLFIAVSLVFTHLPAWLSRSFTEMNSQALTHGGTGAGFPALCYIIIIFLPVMLVSGIFRIPESSSPSTNTLISQPRRRLLFISLASLLLVLGVTSLYRTNVLLVMALAFLAALLWFGRCQPGWTRLQLLWAIVPIFLVLGFYGLGFVPYRFPWPANLWPVESSHQSRLILDVAPWGVGPGSYEIALQRYSRLTTVASDWWGGWILGASTLGVFSIFQTACIALIVYFLTIKTPGNSRITSAALPTLLVLLISGALIGWDFVTMSPLGWLCLGLLAGALPDREPAQLPLRLRAAYGVLAFMLLTTILLSGSASLAKSSARSLEAADPSNAAAIAGRYQIASLLAPWDPKSNGEAYAWIKQSIAETDSEEDRARTIVRARRALRRALRLSPTDPELSLALAAEYAETSENSMVLQALNAAVEHHPDDARLYAALGKCHEEMSNGELALEAWRKAANLEPCNPDYRLPIARLLKKTGQSDEAAREYQNVLWLDYNNEEARRLIGELKNKAKE